MGGSSSSPRKITLENPDETVIKITDTVVERLQSANEQEKGKRRPEEPKPSIPHEARSYSDALPATSHQYRRSLDDEIEKNNAHWEKRLRKLQDGYVEFNTELKREYTKAVAEVSQTLGEQFVSKDFPDTCQESQRNVLECYSLNRNQSLQCSKEVQKFNNCVSSRMNTMMKAK